MRELHITERQFMEEMSLGTINRLHFIMSQESKQKR